MRPLRGLFPHVSARRAWGADGTPIWEFRFTPRTVDDRLIRGELAAPGNHPVVRVVTSRGVQVGDDTLRIDEFQHRVDRTRDTGESPASAEAARVLVAGALMELAADPESEQLHHRVVGRLALAHPGFAQVPGLDISSARITGTGLARLVDGLFVWRGAGVEHTFTYIVSPTPAVKDLLKGDLGLARALVRAACPHPEDALGVLEANLREALDRLTAAAGPGRLASRATSPDGGVVLEVDPELDPAVQPVQPAEQAGEGPGEQQRRSASDRALSRELAELARKVGTASVRKPAAHPVIRSSQAG